MQTPVLRFQIHSKRLVRLDKRNWKSKKLRSKLKFSSIKTKISRKERFLGSQLFWECVGFVKPNSVWFATSQTMVYILLFAAADVFYTLFSTGYMVKTGESRECAQIREPGKYSCHASLNYLLYVCGFGSNPQQGMEIYKFFQEISENPKIEIIWSTHYMEAELFETC